MKTESCGLQTDPLPPQPHKKRKREKACLHLCAVLGIDLRCACKPDIASDSGYRHVTSKWQENYCCSNIFKHPTAHGMLLAHHQLKLLLYAVHSTSLSSALRGVWCQHQQGRTLVLLRPDGFQGGKRRLRSVVFTEARRHLRSVRQTAGSSPNGPIL